MVCNDVLRTHRQPDGADREFDEADERDVSPDRPRPLAIEQARRGP